MGPALVGVSVSQISLLINTIFASFLDTGSVSWLYYADRLMEFPSGMLGVALGTILLPSLSKYHADARPEGLLAAPRLGLRLTLMLAARLPWRSPRLAVPLIATLFHHGAFGANDVLRTREALVALQYRPHRPDSGQVLAPGSTPARTSAPRPHRPRLAGRHPGHERPFRLLAAPAAHRPGALHRPGRLPQRGAPLLRPAPPRVTQPQPGWLIFTGKLAVAMGSHGCPPHLRGRRRGDWLAAGTLRRVLHLSALVGLGAASYFATLWVLGFRLRDFRRRAAE